VLITRTPLRISIGGGGTDLPSYYSRNGGFVISAAIDKYVYIAINRTFTDDYFIKYSALERATTIAEIKHPIVRSALELFSVEPSIEIVSLADIPAGTGLGSSGSFAVGLVRALHARRREHVTAGDLAAEACRIEIDMLGHAVGKQDQYIAAFGGLTCFRFDPDGRVHVSPLDLSTETMHDLEEHLLMFFTGYSREATAVLDDQRTRTELGDGSMLENLKATEAIGRQIGAALERGDTAEFAALMHEHWMRKRKRSRMISNESIDRWYDLGIEAGALGGKLAGAGAGGFLLFYATDPKRLRGAMAEAGLTELRFAFDHDGSSLIVRD
jgi:D-glycero-alpha-D-manno-heptose-7-phosphate kinase